MVDGWGSAGCAASVEPCPAIALAPPAVAGAALGGAQPAAGLGLGEAWASQQRGAMRRRPFVSCLDISYQLARSGVRADVLPPPLQQEPVLQFSSGACPASFMINRSGELVTPAPLSAGVCG